MANHSSPRWASSTASWPMRPAIMPPSGTSRIAMPSEKSGPAGGPLCSAMMASHWHVNRMRDDGRVDAPVKMPGSRFGTAVAHRRSRVLSHVLPPRLGDEGLEVAIGLGGVAVEAPGDAAVPPAESSDILHRGDEGAGVFRRDPVLDRHEDGAGVGIHRTGEDRLPPVPRRRKVESLPDRDPEAPRQDEPGEEHDGRGGERDREPERARHHAPDGGADR